jgi:crotonobetainyl-CoA:carnitine CoA-transferase CaiB-like acyl-CoA transferase
VQTIGCPVKFSDTPTELRRGAPLLGEHGREILREIGYTDEAVDAFVADGVIGLPA